MDDARFDRFTRKFAKRVSRRSVVAAAGALAFSAGRVVAANPASQLTPSTCGASGEVCTLLMGCCDGLTCVTSAINTNYGVCVAGEGGTVSIGTTLISPFSENVEQEVAAIAASETASTTTTTDPTLEREQRLAEIKARKDARQAEQKSRRTTQKTTQQNRREDRQEARELRRGPNLRLELFNPGAAGDPVETLRVTNKDDATIIVTRIETLLDPNEGTSFTSPISLSVGKSFRFLSNNTGGAVEGQIGWNLDPVCQGVDSDDGMVIRASFSTDLKEYESIVRCVDSRDGGGADRRNKRRRKKNSGKNKN